MFKLYRYVKRTVIDIQIYKKCNYLIINNFKEFTYVFNKIRVHYWGA